MINTVYRLAQPRRFEVAFETIDLFGGNAVVRPTHLSICNADMRYYLGTRDAKVLAQKLPMALIHEGIGRVGLDSTGRFKCGDKVVMIPNIPCETDAYCGELPALLQILRFFRRRLFAGICGDLPRKARCPAGKHQSECGGVYGDRFRFHARHLPF